MTTIAGGARLTLVGRVARRVLAPGARGRVLAVFRRSLYVEVGHGLACLGAPSLGPGPLNALCDAPEEWFAGLGALQPADAVIVGRESVRLGGRIVLDLRDAATWLPRAPAHVPSPEELKQGIERLLSAARPRIPADGVGFLLDCRHAALPADQLGKRAATHAQALMEWVRGLVRGGAEPEGPAASAGQLLGLGPGLTPAGDDFIGGALVALRVLGARSAARRLAAWALPLAESITGRISFAHLAAAAEGESSAALHACILALGDPRHAHFDRCIDAVEAIGHTSGWDALAGAVAAAAILAGQEPWPPARPRARSKAPRPRPLPATP